MNHTLVAALAFLSSGITLAASLARAPAAGPATLNTQGFDDLQVHELLCDQCHPLVNPRSYLKEAWPAKVDEMRVLAAERALLWTDEQYEAVLRYLGRHGR